MIFTTFFGHRGAALPITWNQKTGVQDRDDLVATGPLELAYSALLAWLRLIGDGRPASKGTGLKADEIMFFFLSLEIDCSFKWKLFQVAPT